MQVENCALYIPERSTVMLAASTGGHLAQLARISAKFFPGLDKIWVTFDHPQSRSLLQNEVVRFVPYIGSRDFLGIIRASPRLFSLLLRERADVYISTGAAIALVVLPVARLFGRRAIYIESVSRFDGPSATGRFLARYFPSIEVYTQHARWQDARWKFAFSLLDDYEVLTTAIQSPIRRLFVTLGTIRPFAFTSLVERISAIIPDDVEVLWQLGETPPLATMPGHIVDYMDADAMDDAARWADVVVSHAGVGSALRLLDLGISPVLVARRAHRGEHVDDHQEQIARELAGLGLAIVKESPALEMSDLIEAQKRRVSRKGS